MNNVNEEKKKDYSILSRNRLRCNSSSRTMTDNPGNIISLTTVARRRARTTREQEEILVNFFNTVTQTPTKDQQCHELGTLVHMRAESVYYW